MAEARWLMATGKVRWLCGVGLLTAVALSGCELAGLVAGHGVQEAMFKIPPTAKVLVLVDTRPEVQAPPTYSTTLGDRIGGHIYRYKGLEHLVGQDALIELQRDSAKYKKMGVADIAAATGADMVIVVNLVTLSVTGTTDNTVLQGAAEAYVKVVARDGTRLWPGETSGYKVPDVKINPVLTSDKDRAAIYKEMQDLLVVRVGRLFHKYDLEDKDLIK